MFSFLIFSIFIKRNIEGIAKNNTDAHNITISCKSTRREIPSYFRPRHFHLYRQWRDN